MLECDRIDISEGIDVNKTSASIKCDIFPYWISKVLASSTNHIFATVVMI